MWDIKGKKLGVPIYQLLGGKVRDKVKVYGWIGGDSPADVVQGATARREQGFTAVKMNGTGQLDWIDSPHILDDAVERVKQVRALGLDVGVDFHGRVHKGMAKQLAKALEPLHPLFIEGKVPTFTFVPNTKTLISQNPYYRPNRRKSLTCPAWYPLQSPLVNAYIPDKSSDLT